MFRVAIRLAFNHKIVKMGSTVSSNKNTSIFGYKDGAEWNYFLGYHSACSYQRQISANLVQDYVEYRDFEVHPSWFKFPTGIKSEWAIQSKSAGKLGLAGDILLLDREYRVTGLVQAQTDRLHKIISAPDKQLFSPRFDRYFVSLCDRLLREHRETIKMIETQSGACAPVHQEA